MIVPEYLVIRPEQNARPAQWLRVDGNGAQLGGVSSGELSQAAAELGDASAILLAPATDVLLTSVHIPARSAAKIRAALPFALEESLADDVDDLHFASGPRRDDGRVPVAVVASANLDGWLTSLAEAGIEPVRVIAESQGIGRVPGTMSMLLDGSTVMFNDGDDLDFVMQDVKPSDVLVAADGIDDDPAEDDETDKGHLLVFCDAESEARFEHDWIALRHELASVDITVMPDGALPKLAATAAAGHGINLLQGPYGRNPEYRAMLRPWKTAAALVLGFCLLALGGKGIDLWRLNQERDALQQQFSAEYQLIRPGDNREIVDPVNTLRSLQRSAGGAAAPPVFLHSLQALGGAVAANEAASIEAISYRAGVVDIRLVAPDVSTLDSIQQAVTSDGRFQASIQSAQQVGDVIDGRIQIRESGS